MISVEINTALSAKFQALGAPYSNIEILPLSGYQDTASPFLIYTEFPSTVSDEKFYQRVSNVVYTIHDNDIARMLDIEWQMMSFLNVGDRLDTFKTFLSSPYTSPDPLRYRINFMRLQGGGMSPSRTEREGRASLSLNLKIVYLNNSGSIS